MVARLALTQGVKVRFLYAPLLQLGKNTHIFPTSQMEQAATWKKTPLFSYKQARRGVKHGTRATIQSPEKGGCRNGRNFYPESDCRNSE